MPDSNLKHEGKQMAKTDLLDAHLQKLTAEHT